MQQEHSLTQRWRTLASCLAILVAMTAAAPAVSAQTSDSETVTVTANIAAPPSLVLTLCDLTANFGSGLNNVGATPTGTSDVVVATSEGTGLNQGVYYRWAPTCSSGSFIMIQSSVAWDLHQCATQGASTSSLRIDQGDLKFRTALWSDYGNANNSPSFTPCPLNLSQPPVQSNGVGSTTNINFWYYLRVDDDDTPGSFNATTTWTLTP